MANKRPPLSFPELEPKGRRAILRSAEEVLAEEKLLEIESAAVLEIQQPTNNQEEGTQAIGKEGSREVGKEVSLIGNRERGKSFDLDQRPYRKDSFLFTEEEFEALEDLKLELRRKFDLKATKNDLARCAIQNLIEDYQRRGNDSVVVKRLSKKRTK